MIGKAVLCCFLVRAAVTDVRKRQIENGLVLMIFLSWIVINICSTEKKMDIDSVAVHIILAIVLLLSYLSDQFNIGAGDIKLLIVSQLYFSSKEVIVWLIFIIIPAAVLGLVFRKHKKFPLAPFILFSTFISMVFFYLH